MITETTNNANAPAGWLLYDGRCGFCSASARRTARALGRLGYLSVPLQTPWVVERLGSAKITLPDEMGLLTTDNRMLSGVDVYIFIAERWRPTRWLARLAGIGWIDRLLRRAYRWIAAHRQQISATCHLRPDLPERGCP